MLCAPYLALVEAIQAPGPGSNRAARRHVQWAMGLCGTGQWMLAGSEVVAGRERVRIPVCPGMGRSWLPLCPGECER